MKVLRFLHTKLIARRFSRIGRGTRVAAPVKLVGAKNIEIGGKVAIQEHCWLNAPTVEGNHGAQLTIGDDTYIGRFCQINAYGKVTIEDKVLIGDRVIITDADHNFLDTNAAIIDQGDRFIGPVRLGSGCWIAAGAVILPGVTIGRNAVVGANSVVTHDVESLTVVAGSPARLVRDLRGEYETQK